MSKVPFGFRSRDIRATRALPSGHSGAFAEAISARYARSPIGFAGAERIVRRPLASLITNRFYPWRAIIPRVRIDMRMTTSVREKAPMAPFAAALPAASLDVPSATAPPVHAAMLRRAIERERRIEHTATIRDIVRETAAAVASGRAEAASAIAGSISVAKAVTMTTRRTNPPASGNDRTALPADARPDFAAPLGPVAIDRAADRHSATPLNDRELGRVTDHVVHALERRVLAQRERHGRL